MEVVNGDAFKKARLEVRRKSGKQRGTIAEPARGTIEWLAIISGCSIRTIKNLEKGQATMVTIDKVSPFLGLKGRQNIKDYGAENIICKADHMVDFRPSMCPWNSDGDFNLDTTVSSAMVMTLDPLTIILQSSELTCVDLEKITIKISGLEHTLNFSWIYEVSLTPDAKGWLGIQKELHPFQLKVTEQPQQLHIPIMFTHNDPVKIRWDEFVTQVNNTNNPQLKFDVNVCFTQCEKHFVRFLAIEHLKMIFSADCKARKIEWPLWTQCHLLGVDEN